MSAQSRQLGVGEAVPTEILQLLHSLLAFLQLVGVAEGRGLSAACRSISGRCRGAGLCLLLTQHFIEPCVSVWR